MKNMLLTIAIIVLLLNTQVLYAQSFRVRSDAAIQIGYNSYKYLSFGIHSGTPNNGVWAIEHWDGGLNFWKPWPSSNWGNYKLFLQDNGNVGIGRKPSYKLDVQGDIATNGTIRISSDKRFKKNITPINGSMNKLSKLNGVSYKKELPVNLTYKRLTNEWSEVDDIVKQNTLVGDTSLRTNNEIRDNFGFIAQELKEVFPELVTEDETGYFSIDYISLIPVLVEAMKELQSEMNALKDKGEKTKNLKSASTTTSKDFVYQSPIKAILYQNNPNPFNIDTEIKYYLPETVNTAFIGIYNLNGSQIKQIIVNGRGYNSEILNRAELRPVIYL